jgi:predicted anti-sigma-YlaC factor YlaD
MPPCTFQSGGRGNLAGLLLLAGCFVVGGCSVKRFAVNKVGDALAGGGTTFSSDNDPELVAAAVPFSLKLMESLLAESPRHQGLLLATASGFTQYGYAFVQQEAEQLEASDLTSANAAKMRARNLYLRARDYGLRGLDARHRDFTKRLRADPAAVVAQARKKDVPLLYWTAVPWAAAVSLSKDNPDLIGDLPLIESLIDRALALDESWDYGTIHSFLITFEMSRSNVSGDPEERARKHFARAVELSGGRLAGPYLSLAEAVTIHKQDHQEFRRLIDQALAVDPEKWPETRLVNLVMQRRARWLLSRIDELFLIPENPQAP